MKQFLDLISSGKLIGNYAAAFRRAISTPYAPSAPSSACVPRLSISCAARASNGSFKALRWLCKNPDSSTPRSPSSDRNSKWLKLPVHLGGHIEISLCEPIDLVRSELDLALAPSQIQVRMMAFLLGNGANFIYEGQRLGEVFECVEAFKVAVLVNYMKIKESFPLQC
jgi:hypothetical protein